MKKTIQHSIQWWLERLEGVVEVGDGYKAICPAHADVKPSLSITPLPNNAPLVNCFAGCEYRDILAALDEGKTPDMQGITFGKPAKNVEKPREYVEAREWWTQYTGVPAEEWESWGTRFQGNEIIFGWKDLLTEKYRIAGSKEFRWRPEGGARPPIWPQLPAALPHRIVLCEGESDCGVMRHLGFPAFAIMKGVEGISETSPVWLALKHRGCQEIVFLLDLDTASQKKVDSYVRAAKTVGMRTFVLRLNSIIDPLLGEKDPRDVWTRLHDPSLAQRFEDAIVSTGGASKRRVDLMTFMQTSIDDSQWIVRDIILQQTVGMFVGAPKLGKTWLAHDLMMSVATGQPFMGYFPVEMQGPVVYISKEDPDVLLHDRFAKVLTAKGLGGSIKSAHKGRQIQFPPNVDVPMHIDLDRDFYFTDEQQVESLMDWLLAIKAQTGHIALVVFDPVLRMIEGETDVYNAVDINSAVFHNAERIRKETGASVLLVHHRPKGDGEGKNSYGSIGFHAFSEGTQYLLGNEPDKDGWVHVKGEFKSAPETKWAYRFNDLKHAYDVEVSMGGRAPAQKDTVRDMLLLELKNGTPLAIKELSEKIGVSSRVIEDVLKSLEDQGDVSQIKDASAPVRGGRPRTVWGIKLAMPKGR